MIRALLACLDQALEAEEIILSECGHGYRSFRWEGPNWLGEQYPLPVRGVIELLEEYLESRAQPASAGR